MKKFALIFILLSLIPVPGCRKNETIDDNRVDFNVVLTKGDYLQVIQYEDQIWSVNLQFQAYNNSNTEAFLYNVEFRLLLDDVVIATIDKTNHLSLPDSYPDAFYSDTNWYLYPYASSSIKYYASGKNIFLGGKKPQKVEIIAYIKKR